LQGELVSPDLFNVLRVEPLMGRVYTEAEDQINNPAPVAVLGYRFWQRRFGGSPDVLGKTVRMDGVDTTIIGVMPERFTFLDDGVDFFAPIGITPVQIQSSATFLTVAARLKPGVPMQQAQSEMNGIASQIAISDPARNKGLGVRLETLREAYFGRSRQGLLVLQVAVAFVLLIACANVGGLLLARASSRRSEVAVRTALGAGRWRIARQLLTESVILAMLGGVLGIILSWAGIRVLTAYLPQGVPMGQTGLDLRVLGFTALTSIVAGLFFGIIPATQNSKTDIAGTLKESGRSATGGVFRQRLRQMMVTAQIALALMLLVGAGLMINSFVHLQRNDVGINVENVLTFELRFPQSELMKVVGRHKGVGLWEIFPKTTMTFDRVYERLQTLPGITSVAAVSVPPLDGSFGMNFTIEGKPAPQPGADGGPNRMNAGYYAASPKYFATMKIPLLRGRDFDSRDNAAGTPVVIINQTMAHRFWPDEDPLGKHLTFDFVPDDMPREVVGIVGDTRTNQFEERPQPAMYVPHLQQTTHWQGPAWNLRAAMTYVMRTSGDPIKVVPALRRAVAEIDSTKPVAEIRTVEQYVERQTEGVRLYTALMSIFGAVAAALSSVGIYGVIAYSVAQRTHEIGIRMALGAGRREVFALVFRQAALLIAVGTSVGIAGALFLTRFISRELWGVKPTDLPTYIMMTLLLVGVAILATAIPTRRAVHVDPTIGLRCQ
jgi:putative ABC transport system permease protein